jgi:ATP-binding cassette subfamily B protein RaxB
VSVDALELSPFASRRVPLLLQTEAAECALACLAMVAGAHGHRTDLATLRQRFSLSLKGATMADLVRMAGELQFNSRALRVEPEQLEQLQTPCILHWDLNHFVVLVSTCAAAWPHPRPGARRAPDVAGRAVAPLHRRGAGTDAGGRASRRASSASRCGWPT